MRPRLLAALSALLIVLLSAVAIAQVVQISGPKRYGIRFTAIDGTPLEVVGVDDGSIAGNAGVKAGDRIVAMNGAPIAQLSEEQRIGALRASPLVLRIERGKETLEITMRFDGAPAGTPGTGSSSPAPKVQSGGAGSPQPSAGVQSGPGAAGSASSSGGVQSASGGSGGSSSAGNGSGSAGEGSSSSSAGGHSAPGGSGAGSAAPPAVAIAPGTIVVPMDLYMKKPVVQVMIDGKGPFSMFLDTGAEGSVLDASLATELNLTVVREEGITSPGGQPIPAKLMRLDSVRVGSFEKKGTSAVALDRSALYRGDPNAPRGVLSAGATFIGQLLTIDFPGKRLLIAPGALPAADGREIFEYAASERLPTVPLRIGGKEFTVHLDSGAPSGITIPLASAEALPLESPPQEIGRGRRVDREVVIYGATLKGTATLGAYSFENPRLAFNDGIGDRGLIGYEILKDFAVTLDTKNRRIRLKQ